MNSCKLLFALSSSMFVLPWAASQTVAPSPVALVASAPTAVPPWVPYSGAAIGGDGKSFSGEASATFTIYKDESGGEPLWSETQTVAVDASGRYKAQLGATSPNGLPPDLFATGEARWLEVQIAGQIPQPRVLLASVPYALKAGDANTLGGLPVSAFALVGTAPLATPFGSATPANTAAISPDPAASVTTTGGTSGYLPLFNSATTVTDSILFQSGDSIDIDGALSLYRAGNATAARGFSSHALSFSSNAYNSNRALGVSPTFSLQAEPVGNNTTSPAATFHLLYNANGGTGAETGLYFNPDGTIHFASSQTFPGGTGTGTGTITGVTAGTALTGGGTSGVITLNVDTTKVPLLSVANTFVGNQAVTGSVTANASSAATNAAGLIGKENSTTGQVYGVLGIANSSTLNAAGVQGVESATTGQVDGVRGTSASSGTNSAGVSGYAMAKTGLVSGVGAYAISTTNGAAGVSAYEGAATGQVSGISGGTASSTNGAVGVNGYESASTGFVFGVTGYAQTTTSSAAGVSGYEGAATGTVFGVTGGTASTTSSAAGVSGYESAATGAVFGVTGGTASTTSGAAGVNGYENASTGQVSGIFGGAASTTSGAAGVIGQESAATGAVFGVYGGTQSPDGYGIEGANASSGLGVSLAGSSMLIAGFNGSTGLFHVDSSGNGYFAGNLNVTGNVSKGGGSFKIDHPLDPANKYLSHSFVESPDMMDVYNGNTTTDKRGVATVVLPDYFEALNRDFRYQLTVMGQFAEAIVLKKVDKNHFVIRTSKPGVEVSWQVTGIRQDAYANANRIPVEEDKPATEQGYYLHPEVFGQPANRSLAAAKSVGINTTGTN